MKSIPVENTWNSFFSYDSNGVGVWLFILCIFLCLVLFCLTEVYFRYLYVWVSHALTFFSSHEKKIIFIYMRNKNIVQIRITEQHPHINIKGVHLLYFWDTISLGSTKKITWLKGTMITWPIAICNERALHVYFFISGFWI